MFTSFTLNSEIARQRQSVLIARSARRRATRRSVPVVSEACGALVELPAARAHTAHAAHAVATLVA